MATDKKREPRPPMLRSSIPLKPMVKWQDSMAGDRIAHLIRGVGRGLLRSFQMRLYEHGVAHGHWTFLRVLWRADGLTQRQLSEQAGVMEPSTFAAVQAMEKLGYVVRHSVMENRRQVRIFLTPKGAALKHVLIPMAEEVNEIALRGMAADEVAIARRVLLGMIENLAHDEIESSDRNLRMPSTRDLAQAISGHAVSEPSGGNKDETRKKRA